VLLPRRLGPKTGGFSSGMISFALMSLVLGPNPPPWLCAISLKSSLSSAVLMNAQPINTCSCERAYKCTCYSFLPPALSGAARPWRLALNNAMLTTKTKQICICWWNNEVEHNVKSCNSQAACSVASGVTSLSPNYSAIPLLSNQ
jgi:hypothetical protein